MRRVLARGTRGAAALALTVSACAPPSPASGPGPATTGAPISAADLRARLEIVAHDSMMGRAAGTRGGERMSAYLAAEAGRLGLVPAGQNGTYLQTIPLVARTLAPRATVSAGASAFAPWTDFVPRDQGKGARSIEGAAVVDGGVYGDTLRPPLQGDGVAAKLVVLRLAPRADGSPGGTVDRAAVTAAFPTAAGIAVASLDAIDPEERGALRSPTAQLATTTEPAVPAFMYVTSRMAATLLQAGTARGSIGFADSPAPSPAVNVVAVLPGSDPALRNQLIVLGAHSDHLGLAPLPVDHDSLRAFDRVLRPSGADVAAGAPTTGAEARIRPILDSLRGLRPARPDSTFNGADDDGSGSVALLEIAEAMAASSRMPRRSILFVWHTAEELGQLGSDWFTRSAVLRDSIVAEINLDGVGRGGAADLEGGGPAYLRVIGSRRQSTELGDLVERTNTAGKFGFTLDYSFDAEGHPGNWFCRGDQAMYARFGIPVALLTTGDHLDYHQVTDEAEYIDYAKLARVAGLAGEVARRVADLDHRLVVDRPKPDPSAGCRQ